MCTKCFCEPRMHSLLQRLADQWMRISSSSCEPIDGTRPKGLLARVVCKTRRTGTRDFDVWFDKDRTPTLTHTHTHTHPHTHTQTIHDTSQQRKSHQEKRPTILQPSFFQVHPPPCHVHPSTKKRQYVCGYCCGARGRRRRGLCKDDDDDDGGGGGGGSI